MGDTVTQVLAVDKRGYWRNRGSDRRKRPKNERRKRD